MGSPIDPVTGLPMVGVPDVVSQIPLGVQVVPWDDIKAVDRPQGGPSYPNDIINTFAWITGENIEQPGTLHDATMTADRRLRVDTGSSSGGAGAYAATQNVFDQVTGNDPTTSLFTRMHPVTVATVWRLHIEVAWYASNAGNTGATPGQVFINSWPNGATFWLAWFWNLATPGYAVDTVSYISTLDIQYPGGWSNPPWIAPGDSQVRVTCNTNGSIAGLSSVMDYS